MDSNRNKHSFFCWASFFFVFLLSSCAEQSRPKVSFYHWKSYYELSDSENEYLEKLDARRVYVRYFDVGIENNEIVPLGKIVNNNNGKFQGEIIPTIFITNETFLNANILELDDLIQKISKLIKTLHVELSHSEIKEVQFDCDWTKSTKEKYFLFLKKIKEKNGWGISVTIRLHQIKYANKTGIPPAEKYVLMCYNTGNLKDLNEDNSILNNEVVEKYLHQSKYPEKIDIALPLFAWAVVYRDGKLIKLIRNIHENDLVGNKKFSLDGNKVEVLESTYLNGYYLYEGDRLRLESVDEVQLETTARILKKYIHPQEIIYYHLDDEVIKNYQYESLENIINAFVD